VTEVARRTAVRVEGILRANGRSLDPQMQAGDPHALSVDEPSLAAHYAAAAQGISVAGERAGKPTLRLVVSQNPSAKATTAGDDEPVAEVRGVNVHAKQKVDGRDRAQLERLCRYITRPPLAQERLTRRADGRLELELKKVWRDGTRALVLEPFDLLTRLVAAVHPPRLHLLRYFGGLSSHSALRREVVPKLPSDPSQSRPPAAPGDQLALAALGGDNADENDARPPARKRWAWLLAHVFRADLDTCPRCGGPMRWVEAALGQPAIARLLLEHGLGPGPPPPVHRAVPAQLKLPFAP
jgi:hypothetical protein